MTSQLSVHSYWFSLPLLDPLSTLHIDNSLLVSAKLRGWHTHTHSSTHTHTHKRIHTQCSCVSGTNTTNASPHTNEHGRTYQPHIPTRATINTHQTLSHNAQTHTHTHTHTHFEITPMIQNDTYILAPHISNIYHSYMTHPRTHAHTHTQASAHSPLRDVRQCKCFSSCYNHEKKMYHLLCTLTD